MTLDPRADAKQTLGLFFSDIGGSTAMLQTLGPAYSSVLMTHRELLRKAFDRHGGNEMGTEGDSFFITFATASDAVHAAVDAQLARTGRAPLDYVQEP
ncbi:MAG TPA: adenylate/guanylate cyclase domain-containing protein [Actinomycetota bacterium]